MDECNWQGIAVELNRGRLILQARMMIALQQRYVT
jgi:hypothetical protein